MSALDRLLGTWEVTMHHSATSEPITGRQRYEWVPDGAFLLQQATYDHPDFPEAMALLSEDRGEVSRLRRHLAARLHYDLPARHMGRPKSGAAPKR